MSIKRIAGAALACVMAAGMLVGCGGESASNGGSAAKPSATAAPTPTPEPPYEANVLTGEPRSESYIPERITGVMVNNLTAARPQRGLSQADILMEIKVEGGITRFMAMYSNYQDIPEIGPIRSGRDQFFRLLLPFEGLYVHEGESVVMKQYAIDYNYGDWNINNGAYGYRDYSRVNWQGKTHNTGLATEHTMYTTGENIGKYISSNDVDMSRDYKSTFFKFRDYRFNSEPRVIENGEEAGLVTITHSASYKTRFIYDESTGLYKMQQYYGTDFQWRDSVDENNNENLKFTNLMVLYTDIHTYPGHETKDLQYVDYDFGGVGFYFTGGKCEKIYWQKGTPLEALRLYYLDENGQCSDEMVEVNMGKSYLSVVDLDEYENGFSYSSAEGTNTTSAGQPAANTVVDNEVEIGEEPEDVSDGADQPADNTAAGESTEPELIYSESAG